MLKAKKNLGYIPFLVLGLAFMILSICSHFTIKDPILASLNSFFMVGFSLMYLILYNQSIIMLHFGLMKTAKYRIRVEKIENEDIDTQKTNRKG